MSKSIKGHHTCVHAKTPEGLTIADRHGSLVRFLNQLQGAWAVKEPIPLIVPEKIDVVWVKSLQKHLPRELSIQAIYQRRQPIVWQEDDFTLDDGLNVDFKGAYDVSGFIAEVMPGLISAFGAYYAYFGSEALLDWMNEHGFPGGQGVTGNLREGVPGATPVNFWNGEMCSRTFGVSCVEVQKRIDRAVAAATIVGGGIYINAFKPGMTLEQEIEVGAKIMDCVRG